MADGGNPFSRGNTAAKGLANDDPAIRALAAGLVPSFIACTQRHTKALQSGVAALQNLAGEGACSSNVPCTNFNRWSVLFCM